MSTTNTAYKVELPNYYGPLDLLLFLIQKEEVDIYDIPIARITEQYLDYLSVLKELDLSIIGEFLVMAADLMRIKSAMLIPREDPLADAEFEDPRSALVEKLLEYKKYRAAAEDLAEMEDKQLQQFPAGGKAPPVEKESDWEKGDIVLLVSALQDVLERFADPEVFFPGAVGPTMEEQIDYIRDTLRKNDGVVGFIEFFHTSKIFIIVTFLAMLELLRTNEIFVDQDARFGEIFIKTVELK